MAKGNLRLHFLGTDVTITVNKSLFCVQSEFCANLAARAVNGCVDIIGCPSITKFGKKELLPCYFAWMCHAEPSHEPESFSDWTALLAFDDYMGTKIAGCRLLEGVSKMFISRRRNTTAPLLDFEEDERTDVATVIRCLIERGLSHEADALWGTLYRSEQKPTRILDYIEIIMEDATCWQRRDFIDRVLSKPLVQTHTVFQSFAVEALSPAERVYSLTPPGTPQSDSPAA